MPSEVHIYIYPAGDSNLGDTKPVSTALKQLLKKRLESSSLSKKIIIQDGPRENAPPPGPDTYCIVTRMVNLPRGNTEQGAPQFVLVIMRGNFDLSPHLKANGIFQFNSGEKWDVDLTHKNTKKAFNAIIEDVKKKCTIQETSNSVLGRLWDYLIQHISSLIEAITSRFKTDKKQAVSPPDYVSPPPISSLNDPKHSESAPEFHNKLFSSEHAEEEVSNKKNKSELSQAESPGVIKNIRSD